ncbi:MAG: tetratricopeptide repeat protein [Pseudomonadota bacterium]
MSLLIDALKKHRLTSAPSTAQVGGDALKSISSGRTKKIIIISLIAIIVIALTAISSFLIFKHIEKKRMTQMIGGKAEQIQKVKELLEKKSGETEKTPNSPEGSGELREQLKQRMQQHAEDQTSAAAATDSVAPADTGDDNAATSDSAPAPASDATSADSTSSAPATRAQPLRARLAAHKAGDVPRQSAQAQDQNDAQETSANSDDTSSDDASSDDSDSSDDNPNSGGVKVDIKVVSDQQGANNATYQKALEYMQLNQYDKALPLLENNDSLLLKTQGLSALLLARIYLATAEYELADQVLDRALLLHAGSEVDLLELRAQALFMQKKYQETIDLLSSQSPDLSTSPEYYTLLADAYMHLEQPDNAVSVFQQIVARFPNSPSYWLGLAVAYQKMGEAASAIVAYRRAAQLSPNDPQVTLFINQQLSELQSI